MARPTTIARVHAAALDLAREQGPTALTMEGIAARAGVGKQTLYRTWRTVPAILFDALLSHGGPAPERPVPLPPTDAGDRHGQVEAMLREAAEEIGTEPHASLLRALAAAIQTDEAVARDYRERLLAPQLAQVHAMLGAGGSPDPARTAELLLAPVFYRWFMRLPAMTATEVTRHVREVLEVTDRPGPRR